MVDMDKILSERKVAQAPSNLAYRITQAAQERKAAKPSLWGDIERELSTWIFLPRPAYVMALLLLIGLVFGYEVGGFVDVSSNYDMASFMEMDAGDWS